MLTDEINREILTFYVNDTIYGVELPNVIETIRFQKITYVPCLPSEIKGIINLRGRIIPIIDMRIKYNLPEVEYDERTCIVVVKFDEYQVGIIVDKVFDIVFIDTANLLKISASDNIQKNQDIKDIARVGDNSVLILDIRKFLIDTI